MDKPLSRIVSLFFNNYLVNERGYSENTRKSYRDTFILYFRFLEEDKHIHIINNNAIFTRELVLEFLDFLEKKGASVNTRNQRLAALKSFTKYAIRFYPEIYSNLEEIHNIKKKKSLNESIEYLSKSAIELLIKQIDSSNKKGLQDLSIITLMYETGCRVQELINLKYEDISFNTPSTVRMLGKGKKIRVIPINDKVKDILLAYCKAYRINDNNRNLFENRSHNKFTRQGINYILNKYVEKAKSVNSIMYPFKVHCHTLRHTKAMHLLENDVNLIYIRDILGHESIQTTEIYARANPEMKRKYLEATISDIEKNIISVDDKRKNELMDWLKNNI